MSGEDVKANAQVAKGTGTAHKTPTKVSGEVEGYGGKRLMARELARPGRPSERDERLAELAAEIARRKRDREDTALSFVAGDLGRDEKQLRTDVHEAGWKEYRRFVSEVPPAD